MYWDSDVTGWVNRVNPVHLAKLVFAPTSVNSAHIHTNHQNHHHGWCVFKTVIPLGQLGKVLRTQIYRQGVIVEGLVEAPFLAGQSSGSSPSL